MKNVPNAETAIGCFLIGSMSDEEFEAWLNGKEVQSTEIQKLNEAVAQYEAIPIKDRIADLKRRFAAKQKN